MKREFCIALFAFAALAMPALAQSHEERITSLESRLARIESKIDALAKTESSDPFATSNKTKQGACPCTCSNPACNCCTTGNCICCQPQKAAPTVQYRTVCDGNQCWQVPVQSGQTYSGQTYYSSAPQMSSGGCANGNCGGGGFGLFRRRR